jgi:hypothetical protein
MACLTGLTAQKINNLSGCDTTCQTPYLNFGNSNFPPAWLFRLFCDVSRLLDTLSLQQERMSLLIFSKEGEP